MNEIVPQKNSAADALARRAEIERLYVEGHLLAKMLDRVARKECRRLMVFMPPQHGKSELVSRRFPAWMLGQDPDLRLIAASHTHELAVAMNRDVQRIMDKYRSTHGFSLGRARRRPRRAGNAYPAAGGNKELEIASAIGTIREKR